MAKNKLFYRKLKQELFGMLRNYVLEDIYKGDPVETLATEWNIPLKRAKKICHKENISLDDLLLLLELVGLNIGLTLRDPVEEKEITFYTAINILSEDDNPPPTILEEEIQFSNSQVIEAKVPLEEDSEEEDLEEEFEEEEESEEEDFLLPKRKKYSESEDEEEEGGEYIKLFESEGDKYDRNTKRKFFSFNEEE